MGKFVGTAAESVGGGPNPLHGNWDLMKSQVTPAALPFGGADSLIRPFVIG